MPTARSGIGRLPARGRSLGAYPLIAFLVVFTGYALYSPSGARTLVRTLVWSVLVPPLLVGFALAVGVGGLLWSAARKDACGQMDSPATRLRNATPSLVFAGRDKRPVRLGLLVDGAPGRVHRTGSVGIQDELAAATASSLPSSTHYRRIPGLDTELVATKVDSILTLIRSSFILPWYSKISPSRSFPDTVEGIIRHAVGSAISRAETVDWPELLVARVLPVVTDHCRYYRSIEHLAASPTTSTAGTLPLPLPPNAHPALTPRHVSPDADVPSIEEHLRRHVEGALGDLLPEKEQTAIVRIVVREVVLGAIVMPLFAMLCESDFWNRQISEQSAKYLHEKKQVNKVLSALSTVPASSPSGPRSSPRAKRHPKSVSGITINSVAKEFDEFMRSIPRLRTLGEARRLRADVERESRSARAMMKSTVLHSDDDKAVRRVQRYVHRLERARWQVDRRILSLSGGSKDALPAQHKPSPQVGRVTVSLQTILSDPSSLAYWLEYMERRGRSHLVQFWLTVEGFKDPLEAADALALEREIKPANDATTGEDIVFLYTTYFASPQQQINVPPRVRVAIEELARSPMPLAPDDVSRAKSAVYEAQKAVFKQMEEEDWKDFQRSELYRKALADLKSAPTRPSASTTPGPARLQVRSISYSPPETPTHLAAPAPVRRVSEQSPTPRRSLLVNGSITPATISSPSASISMAAPELVKRRLTPEPLSTSPTSRVPSGSRASVTTPPPNSMIRRSAHLDALFGDVEPQRDPLFNNEDDDDDEDNTERMEAIQAALNEIIAEDFVPSRNLGKGDSPEPAPGPDIDPMSMSVPMLPEVDRHPLAGSKLTSRSADDLQAEKEKPIAPVPRVTTFDPSRKRLVRRGSTDGSLHRATKSIFADSAAEEDEVSEDIGDGVSRDLPLAIPGDLQLSSQIARLESQIAELSTQDTLLGTLVRQAELTGNQKEQRLLQRSQSSLQRELRTLEFQAAQYRQQEEENRLVPGRTRVRIPSAALSADDHQVVRYSVEVSQVVDGRVLTSWIVPHRYSEFWDLDRALREAAPIDPRLAEAMRHVTDLPGKRLVPSTSSGFVESRRAGLERYLQSILMEPALCDHHLVRDFLSRTSHLHGGSSPLSPSSPLAPLAPHSIVKTLYKTATAGLNESLGPSMLDLMSQSLQRQLADVAEGVAGVTELVPTALRVGTPWAREAAPPTTTVTTATAAGSKLLPDNDAINELEAQLPTTLQALDGEGAGPGSFTAPICDLFVEVFDLKENNWLRRQAIVIILQQVLGGTIERKFRDVFRSLTSPPRIASLLSAFQELLWPGGVRREPAPPRTEAERLDARVKASRQLGLLIPDMAANMIGKGNARRAAGLVWGALQDQRLNQHLMLSIFDEVLLALFPPAR